MDVLSKVYITILTWRITSFVDAYDRLSESQAGFRSGYSTMDNAFVLYTVVSKYFNMKRKSLYIAFIDFQKAFDSVNRSILYNVLQKNGLKENLYKSIHSIYRSVKACVKSDIG